MFEDLKKNIEQEKKITLDMRTIAISIQSDPTHKKFYEKSLRALADQLIILNNAIPKLAKEWIGSEQPQSKQPAINQTPKPETKKIETPKTQKETKPVKMSYISPSTKEKKFITINEKDKKEFLGKLKLSEKALKKIKRTNTSTNTTTIRKANPYVTFSNKFFRKYSEPLSKQFENVNKDLKKANIKFLLASYLSMAMMSISIAFLAGVLIFGVLMAISITNWIFIVLPFGLAGATMAIFYVYPSSQASSVEKNISYELPFATIHMAAIAGSNISPIKIFEILIKTKEYKNLAAEIKKVLTQVNIYGYDLVTSLKNVAKRTSNKRLAELFSGLATNISSGGALKNYLDKKSENFLVDYRLERQKYSALAGTFMDVYISILIAAPLVLMMLFIIMNVSGLGMGGLGIQTLMFLSIGAIIITNIIFIIVLNIKQPKV